MKIKNYEYLFIYGTPFLMIGTYIPYIISIWGNLTHTNITAWLIWGVVAILNTLSYYYSTEKSWKKSLIFFTGTMMNIFVIIVALFKASLKEIAWYDYTAIALALVAIIAWKLSTARTAQIIVQLAVLIGFIPLWWGLKAHTVTEKPLLWALWSITYILTAVYVALLWDQPKEKQVKGQWIEILAPINYFWMHAITLLLAF